MVGFNSQQKRKMKKVLIKNVLSQKEIGIKFQIIWQSYIEEHSIYKETMKHLLMMLIEFSKIT